MASTATTVNELLNTLEEEDYNAAISYIRFLAESRKKENVMKSQEALSEIQKMFVNDKGWDSEEKMLDEMAEFRRERLNQ